MHQTDDRKALYRAAPTALPLGGTLHGPPSVSQSQQRARAVTEGSEIVAHMRLPPTEQGVPDAVVPRGSASNVT